MVQRHAVVTALWNGKEDAHRAQMERAHREATERDLSHALRVQVLLLVICGALGVMTAYLDSQLELHKQRLRAGCGFCAAMEGRR